MPCGLRLRVTLSRMATLQHTSKMLTVVLVKEQYPVFDSIGVNNNVKAVMLRALVVVVVAEHARSVDF